MTEWAFLTNHARVLLHIAHDPGARLRDIAATLGITERRAHGIITDLAKAGSRRKRPRPAGRRPRIRRHSGTSAMRLPREMLIKQPWLP